jgi:hypothetical protein
LDKGVGDKAEAWLSTIRGAQRRWAQARSIVTRSNAQWIEISDATLSPQRLKEKIEQEMNQGDNSAPTTFSTYLLTTSSPRTFAW